MSEPLASHITFMAGCLARTPFADQVAAASAAGFDSITSWPNIWRHAQRKGGLSLADMRALLDGHGLAFTDVDGCNDWVPASDTPTVGPTMDCARAEYFEVCVALGGTTVVAVHRAGLTVEMERDVPAFANLCDDAAEHGLRVALEFVGFLAIKDVATAWSIVSAADRPNAGLVVDVSHQVRSGLGFDALRAVPADRIFTVQLADGPAAMPDELGHEAVHGRRLPGTGEWDIPGFLGTLRDMGVHAPVGPEVNVDDGRPPNELAVELYASTQAALATLNL